MALGIMRIMLAMLFASLLISASAEEHEFQVREFSNQADERRYKSLINELRCLVCQNQSIADSNAGLAKQLRGEVYSMIMNSRSDQEIVQFMVDRYGDFVMFRPPLRYITALLWFGPFLFLAVGLGYLFLQIRRSARTKDPVSEEHAPT